MSTIDLSGHIRSEEVCVLAAGNVHFVHIDIVDRCTGGGSVEAGEELLKGLILAAAEHGNGLATL